MSHTRIFEPRYFIAALTILGLLALGPSCSDDSGGDKAPDGSGGTGAGGGSVGPGDEICGNNLDDDENGLVDCEDEECSHTEECCPECFTQCGQQGQAACEGSIDLTVEMICSPEGVCDRSGQVDADGKLRTGEAQVSAKVAEIKGQMVYSAAQLLVLSSIRPNTTEPATCAAIMAREFDPTDSSNANIVYKTLVAIQTDGDIIPVAAFGVPLPKEGQKLLAVARFYVSKDSSLNPVGDIVGEGCTEFDSIPEGSYLDDKDNPARNWEVVIRYFCGVDRPCPEPKTCKYGYCRDDRCGTCGPNQTCREWKGEPECRKTCNPDAPECPNLQKCDATPGEPAVCVPYN